MGNRVEQKGRRTQRDPRITARAEELAGQGMPYQMAMAVAYGKLDLSEALEKMARKDKVNILMERHELSRALATQVALGHASLEQILAKRRLEEHRARNRERSCLEPGGEPLVLALHGGRLLKGTVSAVDTYTFSVLPLKGEEPEQLHKLVAKYAYAPGDWKVVKKVVKAQRGAKAAEAPEGPAERPQHRYSCSDKRLFGMMDRKQEVLVRLLEGELIRGVITWFGRYEFGLELKAGVEIIVFRHAMADISAA